MVHILVVEDDAKLNQAVCTYLNDSGFAATGCLSAARPPMRRCTTPSTT